MLSSVIWKVSGSASAPKLSFTMEVRPTLESAYSMIMPLAFSENAVTVSFSGSTFTPNFSMS